MMNERLIDLPLMQNNITREDRDVLIEFLKGDPILTHSKNVREFEREWSEWLGVKYSVMVNSGSSANFLTMAALKNLSGEGEIIVPTLTWVSDIASVLNAGFKPIFIDVNPRNLSMDENQVLQKIGPKTKAIFLTHVLGFNGLSQKLLDVCKEKNIRLIEDVCESHGATFKGKKLGSYGFASNFSFYYAHHMSTIEGGMISTNDEEFYQICRMYRSHGMVREATSDKIKENYSEKYGDLNSDFIFAYPGFNFRSTEINAVLGRNQLKRLDANNKRRQENFQTFLRNLDGTKFFTDFDVEGSVNYAFTLVIKDKDEAFRDRLMAAMKVAGIEFRRGMSGGGNQLRQPYLKTLFPKETASQFLNVDHIHFFGFYIGNFPELSEDKILKVCKLLNSVK